MTLSKIGKEDALAVLTLSKNLKKSQFKINLTGHILMTHH